MAVRNVLGIFKDSAGNPLTGIVIKAQPVYDETGIARTTTSLIVPTETGTLTNNAGQATMTLWPFNDWQPDGVIYAIRWEEPVMAGGQTVGLRRRSRLIRVLDQDNLYMHDPRLQLADPDGTRLVAYLASDTEPDTPVGGTYNTSTLTLVAPTDWSNVPYAPDDDETLWFTVARVPTASTGTITPVWGPVGEAGSTGQPGPEGPPGGDGRAAPITVEIYREAATEPDSPTGGTYNTATDTVVPPAGWSGSPSVPAAGMSLWFVTARIPAATTGTVIPTWGTVGEAGTAGPPGPEGDDGWSPLLALVADGDRRVLQLQSWEGGEGNLPAGVGEYLGLTGLVTTIGDGVDIRGIAGVDGVDGWSPVFAAVADGERACAAVALVGGWRPAGAC